MENYWSHSEHTPILSSAPTAFNSNAPDMTFYQISSSPVSSSPSFTPASWNHLPLFPGNHAYCVPTVCLLCARSYPYALTWATFSILLSILQSYITIISTADGATGSEKFSILPNHLLTPREPPEIEDAPGVSTPLLFQSVLAQKSPRALAKALRKKEGPGNGKAGAPAQRVRSEPTLPTRRFSPSPGRRRRRPSRA